MYTTHLPMVSYTLPTILMQETPSYISTASMPPSSSLMDTTSSPSQQYHINQSSIHSIFGDDLMGTASSSEEQCTSDEHSDIDIDI